MGKRVKINKSNLISLGKQVMQLLKREELAMKQKEKRDMPILLMFMNQ